MVDFLKKHSSKLKITSLVLMLGIPFLLYFAAIRGNDFQVKLFLTLMIINMLFVLKKG